MGRPLASAPDGVLHGQHRRQAVAHQAGGRAGEEAVFAAPGAFAGVEDHQLQGAVVGQQPAELDGAQRRCAPALVGQQHRALATGLVERGVAHEVEGVPGAGLQGGDQLDLAGLAQRRAGLFEPRLLAGYVEAWEVAGADDHAQDADGRRDRLVAVADGRFQVAHQRGGARESQEVVDGRVEEELPGQDGQLWGIDAQADTQALAQRLRGLPAALVGEMDVAGEEGVEEGRAEVLDLARSVCVGEAGGGLFQRSQALLQFCGIEGEGQRAARLAGGGGEDADRVAPAGGGVDVEVEVPVVQRVHGRALGRSGGWCWLCLLCPIAGGWQVTPKRSVPFIHLKMYGAHVQPENLGVCAPVGPVLR